jgi:ribosome-interacting GTPase 1
MDLCQHIVDMIVNIIDLYMTFIKFLNCMTSSNKTDCHNITEVDKQLNLVVPLQNVCASVKWQIYKSLKKIFEDTN